ncbi:MAG: APC family permease [Polyangia bacterium]
MTLIPFLAWIGLGADGLSSSAYGPAEAYAALGEHTYLAVFLVLAMTITVFVISAGYSRIIEHFPTGGGGYVVSTKLLGPYFGVVSGSALLVDYVLTVTTSVAAGGDAIFSMLPVPWLWAKLWVEGGILIILIILNLRGVKESVTSLMPIFLVFLFTHVILIVGGLIFHSGEFPHLFENVSKGLDHGISTLGKFGLLILFLRAYSLGGGTYTGIEAVANGLQIMREPRVQSGKRTMLYMTTSLAFTAGGILLCYLVFQVHPAEGKTLNAVLVEQFIGKFRPGGIPIGPVFVIFTLASEGLLLFVAAQTGFIDGPRVMANMAVDSWLPHRFSSLSDRLTSKDGIILMGTGAIVLLWLLNGNVGALLVMYAINVFIDFSLSNLGMLRFWIQKKGAKKRGREFLIHGTGFVLCVCILGVTIAEKITEGAWRTLVVTSTLVTACIFIRRHYRMISRKLRDLDQEFAELPTVDHHGGEPDPKLPTAVLLVGQYGGVGIHSMLAIHRMLPGYFKNVMFVSVAVIDSGTFKGADEVGALKHSVHQSLEQYVELARRLGWNAGSETSTGIDPANEITRLCINISKTYPRVMFFAGKLIWQRESWWQRILHNETAFQVQRRLQWKGLPVTVIPLRVR